VAYYQNTPVAFCAILHFPHPQNRRIKRVHRLVVLPEWQGIGLGTRFLSAVAAAYPGYAVHLVTSARNLVMALRRRPDWVLTRAGRVGPSGRTASTYRRPYTLTRNTYTFVYRPPLPASKGGETGWPVVRRN